MASVVFKQVNGKMYVKAKASFASQYRSQIRSAVRALWTGETDFYGFYDMMSLSISVAFTNAWNEGASACGISQQDLTLDERTELRRLIARELNYIDGFAQAIEQQSRENKGKLTPLMRRAELWANRYYGIVSQAKSMACNDQKLIWIRHAKDSCSSCIKLENRVYRSSVWRRYNIRPQHQSLACVAGAKGVPVCKCRFEVTDLPVTPGRPPNLP